jgi:hypothetical protein
MGEDGGDRGLPSSPINTHQEELSKKMRACFP